MERVPRIETYSHENNLKRKKCVMAMKMCSRFLKRCDRKQVSPQRLAFRLITRMMTLMMTEKIIDDDDDRGGGDDDDNTEAYDDDD